MSRVGPPILQGWRPQPLARLSRGIFTGHVIEPAVVSNNIAPFGDGRRH
jgi:hypothetical protein